MEQILLGHAAALPQAAHLPGVELGTFGSKPLLHSIGQGQVHVVTAKQDVLADGHPLQFQLATLIRDRDQAEVGGAAADIAH